MEPREGLMIEQIHGPFLKSFSLSDNRGVRGDGGAVGGGGGGGAATR